MEPPEDLIEESVFSDILYDVAVLKAYIVLPLQL
jgi:hypothetical protein